MSTISVNWFGRKVEVIALDFFTCGGESLAVVQAVSGKPFASMGKYTVATPFATVKVKDLMIEEDHEDECTCGFDDLMVCAVCLALIELRLGGIIPFDERSDKGKE